MKSENVGIIEEDDEQVVVEYNEQEHFAPIKMATINEEGEPTSEAGTPK